MPLSSYADFAYHGIDDYSGSPFNGGILLACHAIAQSERMPVKEDGQPLALQRMETENDDYRK